MLKGVEGSQAVRSGSRWWLAAYVKSGQGPRAIYHLENQGYDTFVPKVVEWVTVRGKRKRRRMWMFHRILFVQVEPDTWGPVQNTRGVARIVRFGFHPPARVPDNWITAMRKAADRNDVIKLPSRRAIGERVNIKGGKLSGLSGIYLGMLPHERELVLLDNLGRAVIATAELG